MEYSKEYLRGYADAIRGNLMFRTKERQDSYVNGYDDANRMLIDQHLGADLPQHHFEIVKAIRNESI